MMRSHTIILLVLIILLSGCASNGVSPPPQARWEAEDSRALKVMKAADLAEGLKDVTVEDAAAVSDGGTGFEDTLSVVNAGGLLTGAITPPPAITPGAGAGIMLLDILANETPYAVHGEGLIVWMPSEPEETALAAEKRLSRIVEAAVIEALPEGYAGKPFEWTDTSSIGLKSHYRQFRIDGPGCADFSCLIKGPFIPKRFSERSYEDHVGPMPTPSFLSTDAERSWAYQRPGRWIGLQKIENEYREESNLTAGSWLRQETTDWSAFDRAAWLTRLSQALPEWAFYYIGPGADINQSDGIPMLLNQGNSLLFVKEGDGGGD